MKSILATPVLLIIIMIFSVVLRVRHWGDYVFGFDQVQILENAEHIIQGNMTLIGPRTGPAQMFTGPAIYYVTAGFLLFVHSPYVLIADVIFFTLVSGGVSLYLLHRIGQTKMHRVVFLTIWAISPFLVSMDRILWNPSLMFMASALCFFPLYRLIEMKRVTLTKDWLDFSLIGIGTFLGYQAHFSGLFLPAIVVGSAVVLKKWRLTLWLILATLFGLIVTLIPTLVFDVRNDWLNARGLLALISGDGGVSMLQRLQQLVISFSQSISIVGNIFFWYANTTLALYGGVIFITIFLFSLFKKPQRRCADYFPLIWIFLGTVPFLFYYGDQPEYYYLYQVPAALYIVQQIFVKALSNTRMVLVFGGICAAYSWSSLQIRSLANTGMNFENQLQIAKLVGEQSKEVPVKDVVYDMQEVHSRGIKYLIRGLSFSEEGKVFHVQYPLGASRTTWASEDLGLWVDPRSSHEWNFITKETHIIGFPQSIKVYHERYDGSHHDEYHIKSESLSRDMSLTVFLPDPTLSDRQKIHDAYLLADKNNEYSGWRFIEVADQNGWVNVKGNTVFFLRSFGNLQDEYWVLDSLFITN